MNNVLEHAEPAIKGVISDVDSQGYGVGCGGCSELFADLLQRSIVEGEVHCDELSAEQTIASQSSGFSHRREELSYRQWVADQRWEWRAQERVAATLGIHGDILEKRQQLRMQIAKLSHTAFKQAKDTNNICIHTSTLLPVIEQHRNLTRLPQSGFWHDFVSSSV